MKHTKVSDLGYSLLETVMVILLSAYLFQSILGFFYESCRDVENFQRKNMYDTEARVVSQFIRDEIRNAEEIEFIVATVKGQQVVKPHRNLEDCPIEGKLKEMRIYSADGMQGRIKLNTNSNKNEGKYSLLYRADNSVTQNLISDMVDAIDIAWNYNTDYVEVTCYIGSQEETALKTKIKVDESLKYKR
ncbi:PulJ/GspJ family protein [Cellulosilyticum ruminicola]|uniref:PulJ/GspJ family protein n=1 Tax=Cellulosilyticum ruminicola TaxID=425254 RepID=UPI0006D13A95|nr:hypothetical protein [Cellulosilyticum ruminicola]